MTDTYDVAWLYSSVLQATAALVAIVGGFLVSRSISEKQISKEVDIQNRSIRMKIRELYNQKDDLLGEKASDWMSAYDDALIRHVKRSNEEFPSELEPALPKYLSSGSFDLHRKWRKEFVERTEKFLSHQLEGLPDTEFVGYGNLSDQIEIDIYDAIYSRIQAQRTSIESPMAKSIRAIANSGLFYRDLVHPLEDKTLERLIKFDSRIEALEAELNDINLKNQIRLGTADIKSGAKYLSAATAVGAIYPLALMAFKPMPDALGWRVSVVIAFIAAVAGVLKFILGNVSSSAHLQDAEPLDGTFEPHQKG